MCQALGEDRAWGLQSSRAGSLGGHAVEDIAVEMEGSLSIGEALEGNSEVRVRKPFLLHVLIH